MAQITEVIEDIFDAPENSVLIRIFCAIKLREWILLTIKQMRVIVKAPGALA